MGLSQSVFGPLSKNGLQQNGKNVVADVLSTVETGGSLSKELGGVAGIVKCHVFPACGGRHK